MAATAESLSPTEVPTAAEFKPPSTGLSWAIVSLALDLVEVLVLAEIIFFDKPRSGMSNGMGFLEIYFCITVVATIGQTIGVVLVARHWYRLGGLLQIISSGVQAIKIDGIIGVVGGVKAWRYPRRVREMLAAEPVESAH